MAGAATIYRAESIIARESETPEAKKQTQDLLEVLTAIKAKLP
jgi:hypothetical protein